MTTVQDAQFDNLTAKGFEGSIDDMTSAWLQSLPSYSGEVNQINDLWIEFFQANSATLDTFNDAADQYLVGLGFTGSLDDRWLQFWESGLVP